MPPVVVAGGIAAAGAIGGGIASSIGASKAAGAQAEAATSAAQAQLLAQREAIAAQQEQFNTIRMDLGPYRQAGYESLWDLQAGLEPGGDLAEAFTYGPEQFRTDPGYAFRVAEGQKAIERSAAARGGLLSGRTLKDLTRFGQGVASDEYQRAYQRALGEFDYNRTTRFNRLAALAGLAQTSTVAGAQAAQQTGTNLGNIAMSTGRNLSEIALQAGNARASGYAGSARAFGQTLQSLGNIGSQVYTSLYDTPSYTPSIYDNAGYGAVVP